MHEGTHNLTHTHMQDTALPAHPLSGTQQGGHVLESEGATSLQLSLHTHSFWEYLSMSSGDITRQHMSACVCTVC